MLLSKLNYMVSEQEVLLMNALLTPQSKLGQESVADSLSLITRYRGLEMVHPSQVSNHQAMVAAISFYILPWVEDVGLLRDIKPSTVLRIAGWHDDHESDPIVGDTPANLKDKMTKLEKASEKAKEHRTHLKLAEESYHLQPFSAEYYQYFQDKQDLDRLATPEAEMTKIGDTLHAIWEVFHECLAGNYSFLEPLERYNRVSLDLAICSPIWHKLRYHPQIQLDPDHFPTSEQMVQLSTITKHHVEAANAESSSSWKTFLEIVHNPDYPIWYKNGFDAHLLAFGISGAAQVLFPNWKKSFYLDE